jgi:VanZ family protein
MARQIIVRNYALIVVPVILFILYGSLFPFHFQEQPPGALDALLRGWNRRPERGDAIANVLLYMPLGYFAVLALSRPAMGALRVVPAILLGAALSIGVELTQYYDVGRDTQMADVYTNILGTVLGAAAAQILGGPLGKRMPWPRRGDPAALMLLASWAGYNLFPFAPVIDLHKYWNAVKPVLLHPQLSPYDAFTHAASWVTAAALVNAITQGRRTAFWYAALAVFLLGSKIVIIGGALSTAHIAGAAAGLVFAMLIEVQPRAMTFAATLLLGCAILALRLEPFHFQGRTTDFGWIPFFSFMYGSIGVNTLSFLEKFFFYGGLIWLLRQCGFDLRIAALCVTLMLLATSWAELYLPGRSAEVTDALTALLVGGLIALVSPSRPGRAASRVR